MISRSVLFPRELRFLPGQRWLNVLFRTTHLVGLGGLGAGYLYPAVNQDWRIYLYLTLASGIGLVLLSIYSSAIWLIQLRGQVILLKVALMALIPLFPEWKSEIFILVILISGWISHATANVRYYSLYHRRRIEYLD